MNLLTHRLTHNVASLFAEPDGSSEQVSQAIWGASFSVLDTNADFSLVRGEDLYEGWLYSELIRPVVDDSNSAVSTVASLFAEIYCEPAANSDIKTRLTTGARIVVSRRPSVGRFVPIEFPLSTVSYIHEANISLTYSSSSSNLFDKKSRKLPVTDKIVDFILDRVTESSRLFIGVPYLWGGTTPFGMDCSGFVQLVFKINGVQLLRDASAQWTDRRFVPVTPNAGLESKFERGDLLFFGRHISGEQAITHVGLALGNCSFIHSVGKGRGNIFTNCADEEFNAAFLGARRLVAAPSLSIDSA